MVLTISGNKLTIFRGGCVTYHLDLFFEKNAMGLTISGNKLTIFGRQMYYILCRSVF